MRISKRSGAKPNFGDDLNNWLWPQLIADCLDDSDDIDFLGIGTLLKARRFSEKLKDSQRIVIFSSGCWGVDIPTIDARWSVYGVRGPRTAKALGLAEDRIVGDGAYLLSNLQLPATQKETITGFVPHHRSESYVDWQAVCDACGVRFITARQPVESFLEAIAQCEKVVCEAMHGAIAADIMRVPWVAVKFAPDFNEYKWHDWAESMDMTVDFHPLPLVYQSPPPLVKALTNRTKRGLRRLAIGPEKWGSLPTALNAASPEAIARLADTLGDIALRAPGQNSTDTALNKITDLLNQRLAELVRDYRSGSLR